MTDLCQCPTCGRMHKNLGFGKPPTQRANLKEDKAMTLFLDPAGPLLRYANGVLHIEDLNPEMKTKWRMSRWTMFRLGWRFMRAAVSSGEGTP